MVERAIPKATEDLSPERDPWLSQRRPKVLGLIRWLKGFLDEDGADVHIDVDLDYRLIEVQAERQYERIEAELRTSGVGDLFTGHITIIDYEQEIGTDNPGAHYLDPCDGCRYDGADGCQYDGADGCVLIKELKDELRAIERAEDINLGLITITPTYGERDCYTDVHHLHYYRGATIEFRDLSRTELKALFSLLWALTSGIRKGDL